MVCIIDDREDIWDSAPNLITVKPYRFFTGTGDINAPPGSNQAFTHAPAIPLHENASEHEVNDSTDGKGGDVGENKESEEYSENVEDPSTKDSSNVSEKSGTNGSSGKGKEVREINHNEKLSTSEEIAEGNGECNGGTTAGKDEEMKMEVEDGMQENNNEDDSTKVENEEVSEKPNEDDFTKVENEEVSEKPNEDAVDGNHVEDHDDYLLYLEEILRRIHGSFYEVVAWNKQAEKNSSECERDVVAPDLRSIVPELRRNVLNGTNLVFTGIIPTNCRHEDSQAWKIAKQFGANVGKDLLTQKNTSDRSKRTTHVVAARPGTEKACQALRLPHVKLVSPNWLWTCAERWEWVDERLFPLEEYHEYKARRNDTPNSSRLGTPRNEASSKNSKDDDAEEAEHITEDNLRIVLNPFLNFSSGEMAAMDKEVEDLMRSSDEEEDEQILGSVSSSSNSTENGTENASKQSVGEDSPDGGEGDSPKGKTINFSTIKQYRTRVDDDDGSPSKRRKLDFAGDANSGDEVRDGEGGEGEFSSSDGGSSGSNSGDDDMAAMLEATLNHS